MRKFEIEKKADNSPLTIADRKAHEVISGILSSTNIPVLSEEGKKLPFENRKEWNELWIVDPLDGTKEFIKYSIRKKRYASSRSNIYSGKGRIISWRL